MGANIEFCSRDIDHFSHKFVLIIVYLMFILEFASILWERESRETRGKNESLYMYMWLDLLSIDFWEGLASSPVLPIKLAEHVIPKWNT